MATADICVATETKLLTQHLELLYQLELCKEINNILSMIIIQITFSSKITKEKYV